MMDALDVHVALNSISLPRAMRLLKRGNGFQFSNWDAFVILIANEG